MKGAGVCLRLTVMHASRIASLLHSYRISGVSLWNASPRRHAPHKANATASARRWLVPARCVTVLIQQRASAFRTVPLIHCVPVCQSRRAAFPVTGALASTSSIFRGALLCACFRSEGKLTPSTGLSSA